MSYLTVKTREAGGGVSVVYVNGYLNNLLGEQVEHAVWDLLEAGQHGIVLEFGETRLINSIGISFLIGIVERMRERNGTLAFFSLARIHRELFQVTGVSRYIRIFDSEAEALAFFAQNV